MSPLLLSMPPPPSPLSLPRAPPPPMRPPRLPRLDGIVVVVEGQNDLQALRQAANSDCFVMGGGGNIRARTHPTLQSLRILAEKANLLIFTGEGVVVGVGCVGGVRPTCSSSRVRARWWGWGVWGV